LNTLEKTICNKYCTYPQILIGTKRSLRWVIRYTYLYFLFYAWFVFKN
jgi:hypothetical protein